MTRGIPNKPTQPRDTSKDAIPDSALIDWPIDATPEWIDATFGTERVRLFRQQLMQIDIEYQMQQMDAQRVHAQATP